MFMMRIYMKGKGSYIIELTFYMKGFECQIL